MAAIAEGLKMEKKLVAQIVAGLVKVKVLLGPDPDDRGEYADEAEFELDLNIRCPETVVFILITITL